MDRNEARKNIISGFLVTVIMLAIIAYAGGWFKENPYIGTWKSGYYTINIYENEKGNFTDGINVRNFTYKFNKGSGSLSVYMPGEEDSYITINNSKDTITWGLQNFKKK